MLSGVPQGSVLGALLVIMYINDLPASISSKIHLYAYDVILYREILSGEYAILLKQASWLGYNLTLLMSLDLDKCGNLRNNNK